MKKYGIIYQSAKMAKVIKEIESFARSNAPILIYGETGVGKELVANAVFANSGKKLLVTIDCTVLPKDLVESELFGHERGAFTGAVSNRVGKFEMANNGIAFLDEIGEIPLNMQQKLLRVLECGEFSRVGSNKSMKTNAAIITATNKDLKNEVNTGNFRQDLYYRISNFVIFVPPLRERPEDIKEIANTLTEKEFTDKAINKICSYRWPGNVRELRNVIIQANHFCKGEKITVNDIKFDYEKDEDKLYSDATIPTFNLHDLERYVILKALDKTSYVQKDAAFLLGLSPRVLFYKIVQHGITHKSWRVNRG